MDRQDVVGALAALAQDSRLAVYRLLVKRGPEGLAAGEISERLEIPGPTLSFHLKELAQAGLVTARKQSRFVYYAANFDRMNGLLAYLTENCCGGVTCAPACAPRTTTTDRRKAAARRA
jgi:DNA-binding transcriptional ArsR family regulator